MHSSEGVKIHLLTLLNTLQRLYDAKIVALNDSNGARTYKPRFEIAHITS